MQKKYTSLIIIFWLLIWYLILESAATFLVRKIGNPLIQAKEVLNVDHSLGWRQKPFFKGSFMGIPLKTNEIGLRTNFQNKNKKNTKKVLILGPSSTFGWGVSRNDTYSSILEDFLSKEYSRINLDVINAGQIGFSSWQGLKFYQQENLDYLKADIVIIAYGINDIDKFRFFFSSPFSDKDEFSKIKPYWNTILLNTFNKVNLINLSSHYTFKLLSKISCSSTALPQQRVSIEDFIKNIEKLVNLAKNNGSKVIILTSPYSLPKFKALPIEIKRQAKKYFQLGLQKYTQGELNQAVEYFQESLKLNGEQNQIYYYLSSSYAQLGKCKKSRENFSLARKSESQRIKSDVDTLNIALTTFANANAIPIIQLPTNEKDYFVDPIHFSKKGNTKVAQKILSVIIEKNLLSISK